MMSGACLYNVIFLMNGSSPRSYSEEDAPSIGNQFDQLKQMPTLVVGSSLKMAGYLVIEDGRACLTTSGGVSLPMPFTIWTRCP